MKTSETVNQSDYPPSYYAATAQLLSPFPTLEGNLACDVCIVGAGFTGLSAALALIDAGFNVIVVEANRVGYGASGRNGGQVGSGQRRDQTDLEAQYGIDTAQKLWALAQEAKETVYGTIERLGIECDLKKGILSPVHFKGYERAWHDYAEHLRTVYGYDQIEPLSTSEMAERLGAAGYHGGFADHGAGHIHALNYALGMARHVSKGARIFEKSPALQIVPGKKPVVETAKGTVTADFILNCSNIGLKALNTHANRRIMPIGSYVAVTEPLSDEMCESLIRDRYAVADSRFVVYYYRITADNRMLFGGGERFTASDPANISAFVRSHMLKVYPQLKDTRIEYAWGGQVAVTWSRQPYLHRPAPNIFQVSGYSGHGVALASLTGRVLAQACQGTMTKYDLLEGLKTPLFPGGALAQSPLHTLAMTYFALRDRLGPLPFLTK